MRVTESITHKTNNFNKIKHMPISINQDHSIKESSVFCDNKKPNFSFSKSNGDSDNKTNLSIELLAFNASNVHI